MNIESSEAEVSAIEYVGPHSIRSDLFEIVLTLRGAAGAPQTRLCLSFHPAEATHLAQMLHRNPPVVEAADHLADDIARAGT